MVVQLILQEIINIQAILKHQIREETSLFLKSLLHFTGYWKYKLFNSFEKYSLLKPEKVITNVSVVIIPKQTGLFVKL